MIRLTPSLDPCEPCRTMEPTVTPKSQDEPSNSFGSILAVSAAILAATVLPLLLYLRRCSPLAEVSVDQPDAFYYLTIARNSLHTKFYSFDGIHPTNGFHPVWEFLLYQATRLGLLNPSDPFIALHRLYVFNLFILGIACGVLGAFCARHLHRPWLAFIAVCPGFLWFIVALTAPRYLANWSYLNGMESCVDLLFLGLALISFPAARSTPFRLLLAMFLFGLMVLSRLDDVFFLLPILVLAWKTRSEDRGYRIAALLLPLAMILAYMTYNKVSVGVFMPTSGAVKAGLAISENLHDAFTLITPGRWSQMAGGDLIFSEIFMRVFQLLVPMAICILFLVRRAKANASWAVIEALCVGVLLKGAYNFCNVSLFHQGSWYFSSSIFTANLIIAMELDRGMNLINPVNSRHLWIRSFIAASSCALLTAVCFNIYANHLAANGGAMAQENILIQRDKLRAMVQHEGSDRFIDMSDGELSYATGMQTLSGQGLVLDPIASRALVQGHLFDVASDRSYYLMMASGSYKDMIDVFLKDRKPGDQTRIFTIAGAEFDRFNVVPVSYDSITDTRLYRINRKP
jgi:hypothetical protein